MVDKEEGVYCRGDLVFAKVRGYPPWPARVSNLLKLNDEAENSSGSPYSSDFQVEGLASKSSKEVKYSVLFFGTFERATCTESNLFHYEHHKEKCGSSRRRGFEESLQQIEEAAREVPLNHADIEVKEEVMDTVEASCTEIKNETVSPLSENPSCDESVDKEAIDVDWQVTASGAYFVVKEEAIDAEETPLSEIKRETSSNSSNRIYCEDPVKDETVDVNLDLVADINDEIDTHEDLFPLPETDVPVTMGSPKVEDSTSSTRFPVAQISIAKSCQRMESPGLNSHAVHCNSEEISKTEKELSMRCLTYRGKSHVGNFRRPIVYTSCIEKKVREEHWKQDGYHLEAYSEKCITAAESHFRTQLNEKRSKKKLLSSLSKGSTSKQSKKEKEARRCNICGKCFRETHSLEVHKRMHTGEKPFQCALCNKTSSSKSYLAHHMRVHFEERPYKCSSCEKTFKTCFELKIHMRIHTGEKPFVCKVCGKAFGQRSALNNHMHVHTGEKPFVCKVCGKAFGQRSSLNQHMHVHTGEKPYKCAECEMAFSRSSALTVHKRTHSGEKPYRCAECEMAFSQSGALTLHKRTHSGEKSYRCAECEMAFSRSSALTVHKRTHSGEKPYRCAECEMAFSQSGALTLHKRTHSGEKSYRCAECEMVFSRSSSLTVHKRTHSGEHPYACNECESHFTTSSNLRRHKARRHGAAASVSPGIA